jgi:hypothetical protein
MRRTIEEP